MRIVNVVITEIDSVFQAILLIKCWHFIIQKVKNILKFMREFYILESQTAITIT